jgi:CheY-like chemotaxis protein
MKKSVAGTGQKANFKQAKLLIVEDRDDHWVLIQHALRQCLPTVSVHRTATVQQTLTQLDEWQFQDWDQPKLILTDLYLPDRADGLGFIEAIKALPALLNYIPIIVYSASDTRSDILQAYELGAASYLVKPLKGDEWLAHSEKLRTYWWETATLPRSGFSY